MISMYCFSVKDVIFRILIRKFLLNAQVFALPECIGDATSVLRLLAFEEDLTQNVPLLKLLTLRLTFAFTSLIFISPCSPSYLLFILNVSTACSVPDDLKLAAYDRSLLYGTIEYLQPPLELVFTQPYPDGCSTCI